MTAVVTPLQPGTGTGAPGRQRKRKLTLDRVSFMLVFLGLPLASIIVALFGTTSDLIASFAWVLALSFLATGAMLLQISICEREGAD